MGLFSELLRVRREMAVLGDPQLVELRAMYLKLLKLCLTNVIYGDASLMFDIPQAYDARKRAAGGDWPERAHTMIGLARLDNIQFCVQDALARGVPGDLMEC